MHPSFCRLAAICALPLMLATPAFSAEDPITPAGGSASSSPIVGFGLTFSFGQGGVQTGVGIRLLSGNLSKRAVGSVGLDYMLTSQTWRGTVGLGYLQNNKYLGLDLGIGFGSGDFSFGLGLGGANTKPQTQPSAQTTSQHNPDSPPNDGPPPIDTGPLPTPG